MWRRRRRISPGNKRRAGETPPDGFSFLFIFASGGLLLSVATKVTKSAIQGGRDFDFPRTRPARPAYDFCKAKIGFLIERERNP